jgi:uroporphyrinogen-III synthase
VTALPLIEAGIQPVIPQRYRLGALIRLVCDELVERHVERYRCGDVLIEVGGRSVSVDGRHVLLGPNALTLFKALADNPGVVSRAELIGCLSDELDDHALEVAMSRLRRALEVPDLITTVVRRGYKFNAVRVDRPT